MRLNVILITIDSLRADHLGCYGYKRNTSPNIDKLAQEGVMFTQAISQASETTHSLVSLMTSLYPSQVICRAPRGDRASGEGFSLAQILNGNGYYNGATGSSNLFGKGGDELSRGFDECDFYSHDDNRMLTQWAIDFLRRNKEKRLFLWLHYLDPHGPYRPPAPYNRKFLYDDLYDRDKKLPIDTGEGGGLSPMVIEAYMVEDGITEVDYYIAQYDGEISWTDEHVGILLKEIESLDIDKKSIIVLAADHGEYMGEHEGNLYFNHGGDLYDVVINVPLIFKCNKRLPARKIIHHQVGLIDVMPTILGLLNIRPKNKIEGISLLPFILKRDKEFPRRILFSEIFYSSPDGALARKIGLRTGEWKLMHDTSQPGRYQLYNLEEDPAEANNLVEIETGEFKYLKKKLEGHIRRTKPEITPSTLTSPIDKESKERLRALGYLQ